MIQPLRADSDGNDEKISPENGRKRPREKTSCSLVLLVLYKLPAGSDCRRDSVLNSPKISMVRPRPLVLLLAALGCVLAASDIPHGPGKSAEARARTWRVDRALQHHKLMAEKVIHFKNGAALLDEKDTHSNRYSLHRKGPGSNQGNSGYGRTTLQPFQLRDYSTESDRKGAVAFTVRTPEEKGKAIRVKQGGLYRKVSPVLIRNNGAAHNRQKVLGNLHQGSNLVKENVDRRDMMGGSLRKAMMGRSQRSADVTGGFWSAAARKGPVQVQPRDLMGNALRRFHEFTKVDRSNGKRDGKSLEEKTGRYMSNRFKRLGVKPRIVTVTTQRRYLFGNKIRRASTLKQNIASMLARDGLYVPSSKYNEKHNEAGIKDNASGQTRFYVGRKLLSDDTPEDDHPEDEKKFETNVVQRRDVMGSSFRRVMASGKRSEKERREGPHPTSDVKMTDKGAHHRYPVTTSPRTADDDDNQQNTGSANGVQQSLIYKEACHKEPVESSKSNHMAKERPKINVSQGRKFPTHGKQTPPSGGYGRASRRKYRFQKKDILGDSLRRIMGIKKNNKDGKRGHSFSTKDLNIGIHGSTAIAELEPTANHLGKAEHPTQNAVAENDTTTSLSTAAQATVQNHNHTSENDNHQKDDEDTNDLYATADNPSLKHRRVRREVDDMADAISRYESREKGAQSLLDRGMVEQGQTHDNKHALRDLHYILYNLVRGTHHPEGPHTDPRSRVDDKMKDVVNSDSEHLTPRDILGNVFRGRRSDGITPDRPDVNTAHPMTTSSAVSQRSNMGSQQPDLNIRFGPKTGWKYYFLPYGKGHPLNVNNNEQRMNDKGNAGNAVAFPQDRNSSPTKWSSENRQESFIRDVRSTFDKITSEIRKLRDLVGNKLRTVMMKLMPVSEKEEPLLDMSITVGDNSDNSDGHVLSEEIKEERPDSTGLRIRYDDTGPSSWCV
ncbi:hypothetical protein Bbelb_212320 [Branchiostoma belcheri]|nr:hypothetical protein Bbelb_212320 [Branchiostoma belcheri]